MAKINQTEWNNRKSKSERARANEKKTHCLSDKRKMTKDMLKKDNEWTGMSNNAETTNGQ